LNSLFRLSSLSRQLRSAVGAKVKVPFFFADNIRVFDDPGERQEGAAKEFLQLITTNAVDQETERRKVLPRLDLTAKRFHITFPIGPTEYVGDVNPDIPGDSGHFSVMIHLLRRSACNDQLVQLRGGAGKNVFHV